MNIETKKGRDKKVFSTVELLRFCRYATDGKINDNRLERLLRSWFYGPPKVDTQESE